MDDGNSRSHQRIDICLLPVSYRVGDAPLYSLERLLELPSSPEASLRISLFEDVGDMRHVGQLFDRFFASLDPLEHSRNGGGADVGDQDAALEGVLLREDEAGWMYEELDAEAR